VVTVKHPESNKPKPTVKKNKPIQADLDVAKEFTRCKEEGIWSYFIKFLPRNAMFIIYKFREISIGFI
jgi:hypothetical protein